MLEQGIPESLIERINTGRAVLVVGAGIGIPTWTQLLEALNQRLASADPEHDNDKDRGREGADRAAAQEVAALVRAGNLSRAAGYLARVLGQKACAEVMARTWAAPDPPSELARALARLPFQQVWTTIPGDALHAAMIEERCDDEPAPELVSPERVAAAASHRRVLIELLGGKGSYLMAPESVRRALTGAADLRAYLDHHYSAGTLVFVGFRPGDPDLAVLLDRVFASCAPPAHPHYWIGAGLGAVAADELAHEHRIQVLTPAADPGQDDTGALIAFVTELAAACRRARHTATARTRPEDDDLAGWLAYWDEEPEAARRALERMTRAAQEARDTDLLIDILVGRVEREDAPAVRAALLRQLADLLEDRVGDLFEAFAAITAAMREDPTDTTAVDRAERLAAHVDGWAELVADAAEIAGELDDPALAAGYWARLGRWYEQHLDHPDYAIVSYRRAIQLDPTALSAYTRLAELYRKQQRWAELADVLTVHMALEADPASELERHLALGDLYETQLASTARAIDAYRAALDIDSDNDDALAALERLYRRDERWEHLAEILEARAARTATRDARRAAAMRRELAGLRGDKLGDVQGAIAAYEAALDADPRDAQALRALETLYERAGRPDDSMRALERLIDIAPDTELPILLTRLAAEVEDRDPDRAIDCYQRIIAVAAGPAAHDAYRALERLQRAHERWADLATTYQRHIESTAQHPVRIELLYDLAGVKERELDDPHGAIEALARIRELDWEHRDALTALARLYQRIEAWPRAVDVLVARAKLEGRGGAAAWHEAGAVITEHLEALDDDPSWAARAESFLEKALELDPGYGPAMLTLARLHRARSSWANAVELLTRAEQHTPNRLERIELLLEAAEVCDTELGDAERGLELRTQVLALDPERVDAARRVSERLIAEERWDQAVPVLEVLARKSEDPAERARQELALGRAYQAQDRLDLAIERFRRAVDADPGSVDAALALADALFAGAEAHTAGDDAAGEAEGRYRDLVQQRRHHPALSEDRGADIWYRLAVLARRRRADDDAYSALRQALQREPHHRAALEALVEVARARGDWRAEIEARRALLEHAGADTRPRLLAEIGRIYHHELADADRALDAYGEALALAPGAPAILHRVLDIHTSRGAWRRAIDTLHELAEHDTSAARRAKYHYAAAVIARDELGDAGIAADRFERVLDATPDDPRAFVDLVQLLEGEGDYRALARAYRNMLERVGEDAPLERLLPLWSRLGEIYAEHLDDPEAAIAALDVAASLAPDDLERHEQLAELYLEAGAPYRPQAIHELQRLVQEQPHRVELYRALSNLYTEAGRADAAYCLAQALVFLGPATPTERALFALHHRGNLMEARRRISEELWIESILHPREDWRLSAIFAALIGSLAATTARPAAELGLDVEDRVEVGPLATRVVARVFKYASDILALDPEPHLYLHDRHGVEVLNTEDSGMLVPSVRVGAPHVRIKDARVLAFELGRCMAYFRPERYICHALPGLPGLESALAAILSVAGVTEGGTVGEAAKIAAHIRDTVPAAVLERVSAMAHQLGARTPGRLIVEWQAATALTADRVGLILCNDFETAARRIATESPSSTLLPAKQRLRELLAYSVSEPYFAVRRHLGLDVDATAVDPAEPAPVMC